MYVSQSDSSIIIIVITIIIIIMIESKLHSSESWLSFQPLTQVLTPMESQVFDYWVLPLESH